jgi:hypothetical protein
VRAGLLLVALIIGGCKGADRKASPEVAGAAREAATVVQRLQKATAARDYATICDALLTASERAQAGGENCAQLMAERAKGIRRPRIRIRGIELMRNGARVSVQTTAVGQAPTSDTIRLVREGGRLRIAALGS